MPEYRRNFVPGGTFFFTLVTWDRRSILTEDTARAVLHRAIDEVRAVRTEREFEILCHYIHYNPVKHGHAACPHAWPYSSFRKFVTLNRYPMDWNCDCSEIRKPVTIPDQASEITGE